MIIMSRFFSKSIGILTQKCKYCKIFSPRILSIYNSHRKIEFYMYSFRFCAPAFFLFRLLAYSALSKMAFYKALEMPLQNF